MWIYIVAGERNTKPGAVSDSGGLWANVGQTDRLPEIRLLDEDYRRKAAGGTWLILAEFDIGNSSLTDKDIHKYLKEHSEVRWEPSYNTEEFLFTSDDGTGEAAKQIVHEFLEHKCLNLLQNSYVELQDKCFGLEAQKVELETKLAHYMETDEGKLKAELEADYAERQARISENVEKLNAKLASDRAEIAENRRNLADSWNKLEFQRETLENQRKAFSDEALSARQSWKVRLYESEKVGYIMVYAIIATFVSCGSLSSKWRAEKQRGNYHKQVLDLNQQVIDLEDKYQTTWTDLVSAKEKDTASEKRIKELEGLISSKDELITQKNQEISRLYEKKYNGSSGVKITKKAEVVPAAPKANSNPDLGEPKFDVGACKNQCELDYQACTKSALSGGNFDSTKPLKCYGNRGSFSTSWSYKDSCLGKCARQQETLEQYLQSVKETSKKDKP